MAETEQTSQRIRTIDDAQRKRDEEKLRSEGGHRLNGRLAITVISIAVGATILLTLAVQSSGLHRTQITTPGDDAGNGNRAGDKSEVADLIAHAGESTPAPTFPPPVSEATPLPQLPMTQSSPVVLPKQPSRYAEWLRDKYMKALEAPEMVEAFHSGNTLQIASANRNASGVDMVAPNAMQASTDLSSSSAIRLHPPASPYTVMAGSVIPAVLINGINSDLPGPILAQVSENVYDTATGRSLLIPQGSKLIGTYRSGAASGQSRVQILWQRLIFPNTASMDIPEMPGTDEAGYAGFSDQVNNHYARTFGTAALMSLISAGQAVGQMAAFGGGTYGPLGYYQPNQWAMASQMAGSSASAQFGTVGQQAIERGMSAGPTLEIRPGYQFNVMVTEDLVFPSSYQS